LGPAAGRRPPRSADEDGALQRRVSWSKIADRDRRSRVPPDNFAFACAQLFAAATSDFLIVQPCGPIGNLDRAGAVHGPVQCMGSPAGDQ
jgi:hypothetical protein